jgi:hypothetical protein
VLGGGQQTVAWAVSWRVVRLLNLCDTLLFELVLIVPLLV